MSKKNIGGVEYNYISKEESVEFICSRCSKRKIARKYAEYYSNGEKKRICNVCYGNLCSKFK